MFAIIRNVAKHRVYIPLQACCVIQSASITGRTTRGKPLELRKSLPYQHRKIWEIEAFFDSTIRRVESENAKLIVVDGPIAAGKSALIKALAKEFDMFYIPEPTMDQLYIAPSGFDLREFDDQLPESVRTFDHRNFCIDPCHENAQVYQLHMLQLRFSTYIDALAHILNTGQGVILERSFYSDIAFAEAMCSNGYMSKPVKNIYDTIRDIADPLLLRPHIVIYLDVPVPKVLERIKTRNYSYEVNSPALTPVYLQKLEDSWKHKYLQEAEQHAEILIYDWSEGGDADLIIEDIEKLDPNSYKPSNFGKFSDWMTYRSNWRQKRMMYTNEKSEMFYMFLFVDFNAKELLLSHEDFMARSKLYKSVLLQELSTSEKIKLCLFGTVPSQSRYFHMVDVLLR